MGTEGMKARMDTETARELGAATNLLRMRAQSLNLAAGNLDTTFVEFTRALSEVPGRIIVVGRGVSDCVPRYAARLLSSSGTPALYMTFETIWENIAWIFAPGDAVLTFAERKDVCLPRDVAMVVSLRDIPLFVIAGRDEEVPPGVYHALRLPGDTSLMAGEDSPSSLLWMALTDVLAVGLMRHKGVDSSLCREKEIPGHDRFRRVRDIMHTGKALPLLPAEACLTQARILLRRHAPCVVGVLKRGRLSGIISDADFRRMGSRVDLDAPLAKVMRAPTASLREDSFVAEALHLLRESGLPALFVLRERRPVGLVGPYDCLRA